MKNDLPYIDSLVNEVNRLDKKFDIHLKKHNLFTEPEMIVQYTNSRFQMYLVAVICTLNGMDVSEYCYSSETYGQASGPIGIQHAEFTDLSLLNWSKRSCHLPEKTVAFKCKFLTLLLSDIMYQTDKISKRMFINSGKLIGRYEHQYFYLKELIRDTQKFISVYLMGNDSENIMLKFHQNLAIGQSSSGRTRLNRKIRESKSELKNGLKRKFIPLTKTFEMTMPEDIAIYTIIRLSYMLATNNSDIRGLPEFKQIEGADTSYDLRGLIESLGSCIREYQKYKKRPIMYKAFNDAKPLIKSTYLDINENEYLSIGYRSLEYTKFLMQDKNIVRFINKMLYGVNKK